MFYLFAYFARVETAVLVDDLMCDFQLNASQIGAIVSVLYMPYIAMQIPWGLICDKFGSRLVVSICCTFSTLGVLIFGVATATWQLVFARLLIGFSSSAAYLSCGKIISNTLPSKKYALFMGTTFFIGSMGGVFGSTVTANLANLFGWRTLTCSMTLVGITISVLAFFLLEKVTYIRKENIKVNVLEGLKILVKSPYCWIVGIAGCMVNLPVSAIAELWGTSFIQARFNVTTSEASICASVMFITGGIGCILAAKTANKLNSNKNTVALFSVGTLLTFIVAIYSNSINFWTCVSLFGLCSIFSGAGILIFDMIRQSVPEKFVATSVGYADMFVMAGGIVFQPVIGQLLDFFKLGKADAVGISAYDISTYRSAFACIPVAIAISIICMLFIKGKTSSSSE